MSLWEEIEKYKGLVSKGIISGGHHGHRSKKHDLTIRNYDKKGGDQIRSPKGSPAIPKDCYPNISDFNSIIVNKGYGCGNCGNKYYNLNSYNVWRCNQCGSLYPFIAMLKDKQRPVKVIDWLVPCTICSSCWMIESKKGGYFCLDCQTILEENRKRLVMVGSVTK